MTLRVGFVGLGDIGEPMAGCVLAGGHQLTSSANRSRKAIEALKKLGLQEVNTPAEVGEQSDVFIAMVIDEEQTNRVLRGTDGAMSRMAPGSTIIVMSTVSPRYCQSLASEGEQHNINVLDCPVSGGRKRAKQGALA